MYGSDRAPEGYGGDSDEARPVREDASAAGGRSKLTATWREALQIVYEASPGIHSGSTIMMEQLHHEVGRTPSFLPRLRPSVVQRPTDKARRRRILPPAASAVQRRASPPESRPRPGRASRSRG